jgi:uncharacterized spore protein YtfJ
VRSRGSGRGSARQVGREIIAGAGTGVDLLALRSRRTSPCIGEMDVQNLLSKVTDNLTVGRAFGEPIKSGDILIVPVVRIRGCGGGSCGTGATTEESGSAGGGGFDAKPAGVFVVKHGSVAWQPALDVMRIVIGAQVVTVVLALVVRSILRGR